MAEYSTPEERTEEPTDKRMSQLRKEGAIFHSTEVAQLATLITGFILLQIMWTSFFEDMRQVLIRSFMMIADPEPLSTRALYDGFLSLLLMMGPKIFLMVGLIAAVAVFAVMYQTKWNVKEKKVDFKLSHLNPINGVKRVFSIYGFVNVLKSLVKLALILPIAYFALKGVAPRMVMLMHLSIPAVLEFTGMMMSLLFWKVAYVLIALAIFDFVWGKYQWLKNNRMTKDEVKDERKSVEGDEATRRRIISKGLQRIMARIMRSVPLADVVITNPTHYAVALKYDRETMRAPTVVAKGKGFVAERIKAIAREAGVPVLERKPLARALYRSVEVGSEIPYDLFKAVAEVLAYVYRLKNPYRYLTTGARTE